MVYNFLFLLFIFYFVEISKSYELCGISEAISRYSSHETSRIMGGVISPPHYWPWLGALMVPKSSTNYSKCTAEIIGIRWVLTAKHCAKFLDEGYIHLGSNNVQEANNITKHEIKQSFYPPNESDIVLVELARNITYNEDISSICISKTLRPQVKDEALVAGFGSLFIRYDPNEMTGTKQENTNLLHEGILTIKNISECKEKFPEMIQGNMYCAGGINRGVMSGDSGGPLMGIKNHRFYLWGVVSGGEAYPISKDDDLTVNELDVYTSVAEHCDWLEEKTKGEVKCEE